MDEKKYFTFQIPKRVAVFIYILLGVIMAVIVYNNWPGYVVLNPPVPDKGFVIRKGILHAFFSLTAWDWRTFAECPKDERSEWQMGAGSA